MKKNSYYKQHEEHLSEHFSLREFRCPCCGRASASVQLVDLLEQIRAAVGYAIHITTQRGSAGGFRCQAKQNEIIASGNGSRRSRHLSGNAADIYVRRWSSEKLYAICDQINTRGGVGRYRNFVHVDIRDLHGGAPPRWTIL